MNLKLVCDRIAEAGYVIIAICLGANILVEFFTGRAKSRRERKARTEVTQE